MASNQPSTARKVQKSTLEDSQKSTSGNDGSFGNNSGARRKNKPSSTFVKSRYMQTEKKTITKNNTQNESIAMPPRPTSPKGSGHKPRVGTSPRRTISGIPNTLETSRFGSSVLHSTALYSHSVPPDFDLSVIKENAVPSTAVLKAQKRSALDTFLLAFITAKIEHNTQKLKEEAERNLLVVMKEEEKLRAKLASKKRQYLLFEKQKQLNDLLDLQIEALTPLAETANQFTGEYKAFATAIDTTRHELPVKNLHIEEDGGKFLEKAVVCLNQTLSVLEHYTRGLPTDSESSAECLKDIKNTAHEIDKQLLNTSAHLLELSSLQQRETVLAQQAVEEDLMGLSTAQSLFTE
ncbi:HAUS augmin-like complex subunit 8 [Brachyhypopomus gauderio]|uniref:HAUS augmin-like complex subunit 8 n=1 Tax=Brachyhypopomus gauderio TaxID=698409 RepID=UPI004041297D